MRKQNLSHAIRNTETPSQKQRARVFHHVIKLPSDASVMNDTMSTADYDNTAPTTHRTSFDHCVRRRCFIKAALRYHDMSDKVPPSCLYR